MAVGQLTILTPHIKGSAKGFEFLGSTTSLMQDPQDSTHSGPCWKCKWVDGTITIDNKCPNPGKKTVWTIKVEAFYNEECRCKGILPGIEAGEQHYMCGCAGRKFYYSEPTAEGTPVKFCMALPPDRELDCWEKLDDPYVGGWLQNCSDDYRKQLADYMFTISHKCDSQYPPVGGAWTGGNGAPVRKVAQKAAAQVYTYFQQGEGQPAIGDLMSSKNCDCDEIFSSS